MQPLYSTQCSAILAQCSSMPVRPCRPRRTRGPSLSASAYKSLGDALLQSGAHRDALAAYERALAVQEGFEYKPFILAGLAWTHLSLGDGETALKRAREAANATRRWQNKHTEFVAQLCIGTVLLWTRGLAAREEIELALEAAAGAVAAMGAKGYEPIVLIERARLRVCWVINEAPVATSRKLIEFSSKWAQHHAQRCWRKN